MNRGDDQALARLAAEHDTQFKLQQLQAAKKYSWPKSQFRENLAQAVALDCPSGYTKGNENFSEARVPHSRQVRAVLRSN